MAAGREGPVTRGGQAMQNGGFLRQFGGQRPVLSDAHDNQQQKQPGLEKGQPCRAFQKGHGSRHATNLAGRAWKGNCLFTRQAIQASHQASSKTSQSCRSPRPLTACQSPGTGRSTLQ